MTEHTGLYYQANYDAFYEKWRCTVMDEAGKWCADPAAQALLADAVLMDFRRQFRDRMPPERMEFFIRAQTCLVFSETGRNVARLKHYCELRIPDAPPQAAPTGEALAADARGIPEDPSPVPDAPRPAGAARIPRSRLRARRAKAVRAGTTVLAEVPAREAQEKVPGPEPELAAPQEATVRAPTRPDTFIDPNRTAMWTPGGTESTEHVVQEIVLPDEEEEDERSSKLSLANTFVFIAMITALAFMVYESQLIQHYFM